MICRHGCLVAKVIGMTLSLWVTHGMLRKSGSGEGDCELGPSPAKKRCSAIKCNMFCLQQLNHCAVFFVFFGGGARCEKVHFPNACLKTKQACVTVIIKPFCETSYKCNVEKKFWEIERLLLRVCYLFKRIFSLIWVTRKCTHNSPSIKNSYMYRFIKWWTNWNFFRCPHPHTLSWFWGNCSKTP